MKINLLLYSHDWLPLVGGVQTVTLSLATGLAEWGKTHPGDSIEVVFVTQTPANGMDDFKFPFRVLRHPGQRELIRHIRSADVLHLAGPALLPPLFARLCRNAGDSRTSRLSVRLPEWPAALRARPHDLPGTLHGRPLWKMPAMQCTRPGMDRQPTQSSLDVSAPLAVCARGWEYCSQQSRGHANRPPAHSDDLSRNRKRISGAAGSIGRQRDSSPHRLRGPSGPGEGPPDTSRCREASRERCNSLSSRLSSAMERNARISKPRFAGSACKTASRSQANCAVRTSQRLCRRSRYW